MIRSSMDVVNGSRSRDDHEGVRQPPRTVLLTGATGYVGGRLLAHLESDPRLRVRCLTRRPEALAGRAAGDTQLVRGDVLDPPSLVEAMRGVHTAYYLVHSMESKGDFEALD